MPVVQKVNETLFDQVKEMIDRYNIETAAGQFGLSQKTLVQIANSVTYANYQEQVKAQHPPTQFSMRDKLFEVADSQQRIESMLTTVLQLKAQGRLL